MTSLGRLKGVLSVTPVPASTSGWNTRTSEAPHIYNYVPPGPFWAQWAYNGRIFFLIP